MNPDLPHLIQLQELDLATERIRRRSTDIPASIAALETRLAEKRSAADAVKARMAESLAARREIDKELAAVQGRLSKYKDQLMSVKTNKEYQAMQHEIQAAEQSVRAHEDRLLDRMEEQELLGAELKTVESALKSEESDVARDTRQMEAERAELEKALAAKMAERASFAAQVSAPTLELFERIARHRRGVALSEARAGNCTQCNVRLRPQVFNELRRNDVLLQCENCSRILYFVPVTAPTATQP